MAKISKIKLPNNSEYDIYDPNAAHGTYAGSSTDGGPATTAKKLFGQDTRSVNSPPSRYMTSEQNSTLITEFKSRATIDAPGSSSYGTLMTITPWMDSSGGLPVQIYVDNTGQRAIRFAQTEETWGSWGTLALTSNIPSVGNGTIKLQRNGVDVLSFTTNQSGNTTGNLIVPTKVSELTNDSGYTTNTGTVTSVVAGTGLSGGTITSSGTISLANHSANYLSGGYLNIHPENDPILIPFMNNDIAYLIKRGGSAIVKYDGTTQSVNIDNCFDASPSYWSMNPTSITTIVIELTLHKAFPWTNTIYVDFGSASWRAKNVKIEVMNSNYAQDVWTQKYNNTNNGLGHCYVITSHTPVGASNAGAGFNKVRFTFSSWNNTQFRIAQIGIYNYSSTGLRETFVPKDGGTLFGPLNLSYGASSAMTYNSPNPQILFSERNGSQGVKILYTDYDTYRAPYGLKVIGDGSASGGAWFEVEGNLYSNGGKQVPFLSTTPTSGQVVITDGTTGGVKSSGYTIAKSVPSDAVFTDNNTTYTFATGDSNGQIKVTPSGGTAQNVSVKGLGSAAYTNTSNYATQTALTNQNLNSLTVAGFYNAGGGNTVTNKPSGVDAFGLEVIHTAGGTYYVQILYKNGEVIPYRRYCNNGTWTSWVKDESVVYTSSVNAVVGDTTCTITDSSIATTSLIEPFSSNSTGDTIAIKNIAVTAGQAVLTFKALTVDTSFRLRVTNV